MFFSSLSESHILETLLRLFTYLLVLAPQCTLKVYYSFKIHSVHILLKCLALWKDCLSNNSVLNLTSCAVLVLGKIMHMQKARFL